MADFFDGAFNGMFGRVEGGKLRLTMNGGIAVKCSNGYKTYNVEKGTLTNVSNFCFNVGSEMFFVIPTSKVEKGDIILVAGKPKCVIGMDKKNITVIDYESSEVKTIVPERHIFMGSAYFYGKIVSMFGNVLKGSKGAGKMMKLMMMSQMMGGNNANANNSAMGGLGQMMAMSMFMGEGKNNPFDGMFDFDLDGEDVDETEVVEEKEEA